jgi:aspartate/methionine/tyrosine aminotransferase
VLAGVCAPGDRLIVPEPYHEMYPSQAAVLGLVPDYVTLVEDVETGRWGLDRDEWEAAASRGASGLILNTPHNPTGKVFTASDLAFIADLAARHSLLVISDEIYEHIVFDDARHLSPAAIPGMRERTIVVNSISKTGNATGWRVGWAIAPAYTPSIRGYHTQWSFKRPPHRSGPRSRSCGLMPVRLMCFAPPTRASVTRWWLGCVRPASASGLQKGRTTC